MKRIFLLLVTCLMFITLSTAYEATIYENEEIALSVNGEYHVLDLISSGNDTSISIDDSSNMAINEGETVVYNGVELTALEKGSDPAYVRFEIASGSEGVNNSQYPVELDRLRFKEFTSNKIGAYVSVSNNGNSSLSPVLNVSSGDSFELLQTNGSLSPGNTYDYSWSILETSDRINIDFMNANLELQGSRTFEVPQKYRDSYQAGYLVMEGESTSFTLGNTTHTLELVDMEEGTEIRINNAAATGSLREGESLTYNGVRFEALDVVYSNPNDQSKGYLRFTASSLDSGDSNSDPNSGSGSGPDSGPEVPQLPSSTAISLSEGWNMISAEGSFQLSQLQQKCDIRPYLDNFLWRYSGDQWYNSQTVNSDSGYYVYSSTSCDAQIQLSTQNESDQPQSQLSQGWNMISVSSSTTLSGIKGQCNVAGADRPIWRYNPSIEGWDRFSATDQLEPNKGYFVNVNSDCSLNRDHNSGSSDSSDDQTGSVSGTETFTASEDGFMMEVVANHNSETYDLYTRFESPRVMNQTNLDRQQFIMSQAEPLCQFMGNFPINYEQMSYEPGMGNETGQQNVQDAAVPDYIFRDYEPTSIEVDLYDKQGQQKLATCQPTQNQTNIEVHTPS